MALLRHERRVSSGGRCATFGRYLVILLLARGSEAADDEESMAQQPGDDSIALMESGLDLVFNVGGKRTEVPRLDATDFHTATDATTIVCDNEEHRCYVPASRLHLCPIVATTKPPWCSDRMTLLGVTPLPSDGGWLYKDDRKNTAVLRWSLVNLLPTEWYRVAYERKRGSQPLMAALPGDTSLPLGAWPPLQGAGAVSKATKQDGYAPESVRLVLYPPAWRFFRLRMDVPLRMPDALTPFGTRGQYRSRGRRRRRR